MMRSIIEEHNHKLLRDLKALRRLIEAAPIPSELEPYRTSILQVIDGCETTVRRNRQRLELYQVDIDEELLSDTQQAIFLVRLLSEHLAIPLLRASPSDRLCVSLIRWMHTAHPETASSPAAFANGSCSILPLAGIPLYYFPCVEQQSLLFLPLLFHELGHLLYKCHKQEMDSLVGELQQDISDLLMPASQRNDRYDRQQASRRQIIINTWYSWIQELFCDAVGFTVGGPCFLQAISSFLNPLQQLDFYYSFR